MLTLLPLPTFKDSARVLLTEDLRNSLIDGLTILELIRIPFSQAEEKGVSMWRGYDGCLNLYCRTFLTELKKREVEIGVLEKEIERYPMPSLDRLPGWFFENVYERAKINYSHIQHLHHINDEYKSIVVCPLYTTSFDKIHYPRYSPPSIDPILLSSQ